MDKNEFMKVREDQRKKTNNAIHMMDFAEWCQSKDLIGINEDGTVYWKENENGEKIKNHTSDKINGPRDGAKDLSSDYPGHIKSLGNSKSSIWPFKLKVSNKPCKPIAPVGK